MMLKQKNGQPRPINKYTRLTYGTHSSISIIMEIIFIFRISKTKHGKWCLNIFQLTLSMRCIHIDTT